VFVDVIGRSIILGVRGHEITLPAILDGFVELEGCFDTPDVIEYK
jgi:hypothetical protein